MAASLLMSSTRVPLLPTLPLPQLTPLPLLRLMPLLQSVLMLQLPSVLMPLPPSVPVAFPQLLAPFVPEWAKVPFDVTLRRVEDQRTELDRMSKVLEQRDAEVA